jgi:hypothetical protein
MAAFDMTRLKFYHLEAVRPSRLVRESAAHALFLLAIFKGLGARGPDATRGERLGT